MADIAHTSGLIIGKQLSSPFDYGVDIVTMTTHKSLKGPKGALIFAKKKFEEKLDMVVDWVIGGAPHYNNMAAIAVQLKEAQT